jgi:hypothetical protein
MAGSGATHLRFSGGDWLALAAPRELGSTAIERDAVAVALLQ